MALLEVRDLSVRFRGDDRPIDAVRGVSFHIEKGETLALVGEIGLGQVGDRALDPPASALSRRRRIPRARCGSTARSCWAPTRALLRQVRGGRVGMIFQEPMTSLNPLHTVERQIGEALALHRRPAARRRRARARSSCWTWSASPMPRRG